ncbi:MAG: pyridoxamine 5'-phosphate oxidase [Longimicrobiales bacterium]|nr:pyridoxamine 5'-phosphate oxidase [Longimicrobiales bacterium]
MAHQSPHAIFPGMTTLKAHLQALLTLGRGVVTGLPDPAGDEDPFDLFRDWYRTAEESGLFMPEAMALATASADGAPSARMVLLKDFDARGFTFYTNYESRKARELDENPRAALTLHWAVLERQVRIEGTVHRVSQAESLAYFRTRPRGSRIGAWASAQSRPLAARADLEARVRETEARFRGDAIPLPPFWGGYRVVPTLIEFWQGRADRLHDRWVFRRGDAEAAWTVERLHP